MTYLATPQQGPCHFFPYRPSPGRRPEYEVPVYPQTPALPATVAGPRSKANSQHLRDQWYKTKMCPHWPKGVCFRQEACCYAHTNSELREPPRLWKTKLCQAWLSGVCPIQQEACRFAHGEGDLWCTPDYFKTDICKYWRHGQCNAADLCRHAHGCTELRQRNYRITELERRFERVRRQISSTSSDMGLSSNQSNESLGSVGTPKILSSTSTLGASSVRPPYTPVNIGGIFGGFSPTFSVFPINSGEQSPPLSQPQNYKQSGPTEPLTGNHIQSPNQTTVISSPLQWDGTQLSAIGFQDATAATSAESKCDELSWGPAATCPGNNININHHVQLCSSAPSNSSLSMKATVGGSFSTDSSPAGEHLDTTRQPRARPPHRGDQTPQSPISAAISAFTAFPTAIQPIAALNPNPGATGNSPPLNALIRDELFKSWMPMLPPGTAPRSPEASKQVAPLFLGGPARTTGSYQNNATPMTPIYFTPVLSGEGTPVHGPVSPNTRPSSPCLPQFTLLYSANPSLPAGCGTPVLGPQTGSYCATLSTSPVLGPAMIGPGAAGFQGQFISGGLPSSVDPPSPYMQPCHMAILSGVGGSLTTTNTVASPSSIRPIDFRPTAVATPGQQTPAAVEVLSPSGINSASVTNTPYAGLSVAHLGGTGNSSGMATFFKSIGTTMTAGPRVIVSGSPSGS